MFTLTRPSFVRRTATTALVVVLLSALLASIASAADTGWRNPASNLADSGGDVNGFELNPANAYTDGAGNASNMDGPGDRHRYWGYDFSAIPSDATIQGIEVRLDWWLSSTSGTNSMSVELSWDGGTSWTAAQTTTTEPIAEATTILGGAAYTWGRTWTAAQLNTSNFRVRVTSTCTGFLAGCDGRDFYLDWVPVRVTYALPTTTTLASSLNPSLLGNSVTFTATVTSTSGTPTGTVTFYDGANAISGAVALTSGSASFSTSALAAGSHNITARYGGNTNYTASTSAILAQVVNQAPVITAVTNAVFTVNTSVGNFNAVDADGYPAPTFSLSAALPNGLSFNAATGVITGTPALGTVGTYNYTMTASNGILPDATAPFTLTINRANQTITFTIPGGVGGYHTTFTVTPTATSGLPVTVVTTTPAICTVTPHVPAPGWDVYMLAGTGTCTLVASQAGDANYNAAPPQTRNVAAVPAATTTTIISSVNPSVLGQNVIFTVTVTSAGGTPTGTVTLTECAWATLPFIGSFCVGGTNTIGNATLVNGIATFNIDTLTVPLYNGIIIPHHVVATFTPAIGTPYNGSTDDLVQTVGTANTATTLTSSINPSYFGQEVTFTATVTVLPPGAGQISGGTVSFYEAGNPTPLCPPQTVNASGVATCTISTLSRGTHDITAHFLPPNTDFGTSTSPVLTQIVRRESETALTSLPNPSVYGNAVTFTTTVTDPGGFGTPTGTVTFQDITDPLNPIVLGTTNLNGSAVAILNYNALAVGSHNITATYNGNNFYVASTSLVLVQVVDPATLTVTADPQTITYGDFDPPFTYQYTAGFVLGDDAADIDVPPSCTASATPHVDAGTYPGSIVCSGASDDNYIFTYVNGTLTVNQKGLTITAIDQGKTYGMIINLNGTEFYALGLIFSDTVDSVSLSCPECLQPLAPRGTYPIIPSAAVGTGLSNYAITYVNGTLTIAGNILEITADNQTKTYGQTFTFNGTEFTATGLKGSDTVTSVTLSSLGVSPNAEVNTYAIIPSAAVGSGLSNYYIVYQPGVMTINPAPLTFDPNSHTKLYGDVFTGYTGTFTGLFAFDNDVTPVYYSAGAPATATVTAPGPVYPITVSFDDPRGRLSNYTLDPAPAATLTVLPRTLTVIPTDRSKQYGDTPTVADFTGTITGIQNGDNITATYDSPLGDPANAPIGTYDIEATLSDPDGRLGNYALDQRVGTLTVTRRSLVVTSDSQFKIYGETFNAFTGSVVGLIPGDVVTPTYDSAGAIATAPVGIYNITVLPLDDPGGVLGNYNVTYNIGTLAVLRRDLVFTANDQTKIYGDTFSAFTGTVTGLQPGDDITPNYSSPGAVSTASVADSPYPIIITLNDPDNKLGNYNYTLNSGLLTVTQRSLIVQPDNQTKIYGSWFLAFTGTITGIQNGENITANYASAGSDPTAQVGTYPITATLNDPTGKLDNYDITLNTGTLTVTRNVLTVTADSKTISYGDPDPVLTFSYSGFLGSDGPAVVDTPPTCFIVENPHTAIGPYTISCAGGADNNYSFTYIDGTLTVTRRTLVVTPANQIKTYGDVFNAFTGTITGIQGADDITATYSSPGSLATAAVGPYLITPALVDPGGVLGNYIVTLNTGTLTVIRRDLVITPNNKTKVYGDNLTSADFTGTIIGIQNGDPITATYASLGSVPTATVAGSPYTITATMLDPLGLAGNYNVTINTALLTVTRRPLVVTPDNQSKVFGTTFTAFTGTITGIQNDENITANYDSPGAIDTAPVGTYPITATLVDPDGYLPNYTVTYNTGTLTVGNTLLTITADPQTKTYGDADPVFTFVYSGFEGTDGPTDLISQPTCQVLPPHNAVGTFLITCSGGVDENYAFNYVGSILTVTARPLTVTPDNKTKVYGSTFTAFTGVVTGLMASDNITITYDSLGALATATVAGSPYTITATLNDPNNRLGNYTQTIGTGLLTVTPRALVVTPDNKNKVYGDVFSAYTGTISGIQNGENITATYSSPGEIATATVGTYMITPALVDPDGFLPNYAVTLNTGILTVTRRDLVVTPADKYKTYGELFTAFTGTIVGIQNGDDITATYSSTGAPASAPMGTYPIIVDTLIDPTGRLPNYNVISNTGTLTVGRAIPTIAVDSDINPSMIGQLVTFTATVSSTAGTPTGTVTFRDGATNLGTRTLNAAGVATFSTSALTLGSHSITVVYGGDANFAGTTSAPYIQSVGLSPTTTTIASSVNPSLYGQSVIFTATVSSTLSTPTGTVTFRDGATILGTGALNAAGVATFTTSTLAVGPHGITAAYGGDANFAVSTSFMLTQVVNRANTTTTITSNINPSLLGQAVTFTATVTSAAGTPTGTVSFNEGATSLGTGTLNAAGVATFSTSILTVGPHNITAIYGGDANFAVSTSLVLVQVVNRANTITTVTSNINPSAYSQLVTFTATVSATAGVPTGTVTFRDGATTLGTGTLVGGAVNFSTSTLAAGSHNIAVDYGGNPNFNVSTSPVLIQVVNKGVSITTLASNNNPSLYGQSVTFTATVTSGVGTPTGTVTFDEGAITLGTGTLNAAGVAVFNTSTLVVGSHNITATYGGDATYTSSTSVELVQVVNKLTPTVTTAIHDASHTVITSAPVGSVVHDAALVSGTGPVPTGTVAFRAFTNATCSGAGTAAGNIPLDAAGVADPSTPATVGGSGLSFQASYSGDAIYTSATSACETFNAPPHITSADNVTFAVGTAGTFTVTADGYPAPTFTRAGDALPTGVTFDGITGVLGGTPAAGADGTYNLIFTATNGVLPNDIQDFTLTVNKALAVISSLRADPNPTDASSVDFTVTFNDNVSSVDVADFSLTYLGPTGATVTTVAGSGSVYTVTVKTGSGNGPLRLDLIDNDTIQDTSGSPLGGSGPWNGNFTTGEYYVIDRTAPIVIASTPSNNALVIGMSQLEVTFNKDVLNDGTAQAANNLTNYLLVAPNGDGFQTVNCRGGLKAGDTAITINTVTYDPARFTSTLQVNDGAELPVGTYRIYICGTTSITSPAGAKLNNGLNDTQINFTVITIGGDGGGGDGGGGGTKQTDMPDTGFPMGKVTPLPEQSPDDAYTSYGDLWLEIPRLGVKASIVGVPQKNGSWDVSWLWDQAGYLEGSAFPTGSGNSVITAHVYLSNGEPGPFVSLNTLTWGDQIIIHAYGQQYVYEVRSATQVKPNAVSTMMKHEDLAWLTLVTCRGYNESTDEYQYRVLIRAVLVKTK